MCIIVISVALGVFPGRDVRTADGKRSKSFPREWTNEIVQVWCMDDRPGCGDVTAS